MQFFNADGTSNGSVAVPATGKSYSTDAINASAVDGNGDLVVGWDDAEAILGSVIGAP